MATPREIVLACPACDGPGIYAMRDRFRSRVWSTSNRFVQRQRYPVRVLYVACLEPGEAPRAWRALLSSLRAQGLEPTECQFEAGAAHDVARSMTRAVWHRSGLDQAQVVDVGYQRGHAMVSESASVNGLRDKLMAKSVHFH